ncbi:PREDICTED: uncharacterized protein LOC109172762 [Ipomoea nil]|uniref:uncharacterized protein LOC109172762 n=1 Tax=Ipomoea nil TaxID=35883 RepID=UPI000900BE74|nr:PREDICTED: uncharacterized protein LOC109172762 [Ipomoea nil]XP_019177564.1 PREDICTED: uncharacterized protein LOC109172762 [Ipomoea nil]XP_019177565.1 PREDICTED: uncharacterized protein LOC109172762 [Ipomoea nil]XP_019177566.1 PREDICTED: uncharacterized protein LOC109172762 [Ipomoea nil]XP_019177567.1 PREDICTED: uncharacterized protein LOC109172762 [Ipomoea nil]
MREDSISDGSHKPRSVFRDVTNQLGKRSSSLISGKKPGDRERENLGTKRVLESDGNSGKRACLSPRESVENNPLTRNAIVDSLKNPVGSKTLDVSYLDKHNAITRSVSEGLRKGYVAGISGATGVSGSEGQDVGKTFEASGDRASSESTESDTNGCQNEGEEHGAENLVISQSGSIDYSRFLESQESQVEPEKCTELKAIDGCSEPVIGIDSTKTCPCSFCTKAAYMWLDLHYQDAKGRIAALKKSQKEASILVERSSKGKAPQKYGTVHNSDVSNLELSLWGQWRSLFLHMENIYECEISQLESSLLSLTDLKERCKAELELINKAPPEPPEH